MNNSPLVQYTRISPNSNNPRNHKIDKITIHHTAGVVSVETLGNIFAPESRQASSNYGIGSDGRIAMFVEEKNRSWCSSSWDNDQRAITIEVSNSATGGNWPVSDYVLSRLIELCVDICKRNGIERLNYTGDTSGNLTMHRWFANTSCPGDYLASKFPYIADEVNKRLTPAAQLKAEPIAKKSVRLNCDANLWDLNFSNYDDAKSVKQFKAGDIIDNIVAVVNHPVGSKYYLTEYSYNNGIMNGFNAVDCDDIGSVEPEPTPTPTPSKTVDELANEVIEGIWGNNPERKASLEAAGYDYEAVQARVNEILAPAPAALAIGDTVEITGTGNGDSYGTSNTAYGLGWTRTILGIYEGREFPYMVGDSTGVTGFYKANALSKK